LNVRGDFLQPPHGTNNADVAYLEYSSVIRSSKSKTKIDAISIQSVQRRSTRLHRELSGKEYNKRILDFGILILEYIRKRADIRETCEIISKIDKTKKYQKLEKKPIQEDM
jgi:hypothetical protein